jgi:hypothetical protein
MVELSIDPAAVRRLVDTSANRVADLIESAPSSDAPVRHLEWTVGELAAHIAMEA